MSARIRIFHIGARGNVGTHFTKELSEYQQCMVIGTAGRAGCELSIAEGEKREFPISELPNQLLQHVKEPVVVVDNSGTAETTELVKDFLSLALERPELGIRVVLANKKPLTSGSPDPELFRLAFRSKFLGLRAVVGAGLPIVDWFWRNRRTCLSTPDKLVRVDGLLSGSLASLAKLMEQRAAAVQLENSETSRDFDIFEAIRGAVSKGQMEPDSAEDLLGRDVRRKMRIIGEVIFGLRIVEDSPEDNLPFLQLESGDGQHEEENKKIREILERPGDELHSGATPAEVGQLRIQKLQESVPGLGDGMMESFIRHVQQGEQLRYAVSLERVEAHGHSPDASWRIVTRLRAFTEAQVSEYSKVLRIETVGEPTEVHWCLGEGAGGANAAKEVLKDVLSVAENIHICP